MKLGASVKSKRTLSKGSPKIRFSSPSRRLAFPEMSGNICIIRSLGGIGDILMITPALRALKLQYPNCTLYFAIDLSSTNSYYELTKNLPFIDHIINVKDVGKYEFDWVRDITTVCIRHEHSSLPKKNRIDVFAEALGLRAVADKLPSYFIEEDEARRAFKYRKDTKMIFLHTASFDAQRTPDVSIFIEIVKHFPEYHFFISDFNNQYSDWNKMDNCTDVSRETLRDKAAIINLCDLFIGPDSGLMHLAAAVKTKSIVIFGSIPSECRINYYPTHTAFKRIELDCLGCWYKPCPHNLACMKNFNTDALFKMIDKI